MLTEETIKQIASEESHHVCESGAPNAKQHDTRAVEQAIKGAVGEITPDETAELREHIVSLQFQLKTAQSQNYEHEQDYLAVWKLIKQPNETVVDATKRVMKELAAAQKEIESEQSAHSEIASICFKAGAESSNGTSISAVKSLATMVEELKRDKERLAESLRSIIKDEACDNDGRGCPVIGQLEAAIAREKGQQ